MSAPPSAPLGRRAAAVALYREAVPLKEIAARLGCSASGVNWLLGRAGVARVRKSVDDLTGLRSGSLVVVEMAGKDDGDGTLWLCRCDCGAARVVGRARLTTARSKATACVDCTEARGARGRRPLPPALRADRGPLPHHHARPGRDLPPARPTDGDDLMSHDLSNDNPTTIREWQRAMYATAASKGFHDGETPATVPFGEKIALIHSEASEALEAFRDPAVMAFLAARRPEGDAS